MTLQNLLFEIRMSYITLDMGYIRSKMEYIRFKINYMKLNMNLECYVEFCIAHLYCTSAEFELYMDY